MALRAALLLLFTLLFSLPCGALDSEDPFLVIRFDDKLAPSPRAPPIPPLLDRPLSSLWCVKGGIFAEIRRRKNVKCQRICTMTLTQRTNTDILALIKKWARAVLTVNGKEVIGGWPHQHGKTMGEGLPPASQMDGRGLPLGLLGHVGGRGGTRVNNHFAFTIYLTPDHQVHNVSGVAHTISHPADPESGNTLPPTSSHKEMPCYSQDSRNANFRELNPVDRTYHQKVGIGKKISLSLSVDFREVEVPKPREEEATPRPLPRPQPEAEPEPQEQPEPKTLPPPPREPPQEPPQDDPEPEPVPRDDPPPRRANRPMTPPRPVPIREMLQGATKGEEEEDSDFTLPQIAACVALLGVGVWYYLYRSPKGRRS